MKKVFFLLLSVASWSFGAIDLYNKSQEIEDALSWPWCNDQYFMDKGLWTPWLANNRIGASLSNTSCEEMKQTWELYARNLEYSDGRRNSNFLAKQDVQANHPYFALYNRYTGVLRVFLWLTANDVDNGYATSIDADIATDVSTSTEPTHLMNFHENNLIRSQLDPIKPALSKNWIFPTTVPDKWYVMDLFLNYDSDEYLNSDGSIKQLFIRFTIYSLSKSSFRLTGTYTEATTTVIGNGKDFLSFIPGNGQDVGSISPSIADFGTAVVGGIDGNQFDSWLNSSSQTQLRSAAIDWSTGNVVSGALKAISLIPKVFSTKSTTEIVYIPGTINLTGELNTVNSSGLVMIPYSGSVNTEAPLYAYKYPNPALRKLGLFNLQRYIPKKRLEQVSCYLKINPNSPSQIREAYNQPYDFDTIFKQTPPCTFCNPVPAPEILRIDTNQQISVIAFHDPSNPYATDRQATLSLQIPRFSVNTDYEPFYNSGVTNACAAGAPGQIFNSSDLNSNFSIITSEKLKLNDNTRLYDFSGNTLIFGDAMRRNAYGFGSVELGFGATLGNLYTPNGDLFMREKSSITYALWGQPSKSYQNNNTNYIGSQLASIPSELRVPDPKVSMKFLSTDHILLNKPDYEISGQGCQYNLKTFASTTPTSVCKVSQNGSTLYLEPGVYGTITVRGGSTIQFKPGVYWISRLYLESNSIFNAENATNSTYIYVTNDLQWRATPRFVNPKRLILIYMPVDRIANLETNFSGTFINESPRLIMGQVGKEYHGQFFSPDIELHQQSSVFHEEFLP